MQAYIYFPLKKHIFETRRLYRSERQGNGRQRHVNQTEHAGWLEGACVPSTAVAFSHHLFAGSEHSIEAAISCMIAEHAVYTFVDWPNNCIGNFEPLLDRYLLVLRC